MIGCISSRGQKTETLTLKPIQRKCRGRKLTEDMVLVGAARTTGSSPVPMFHRALARSLPRRDHRGASLVRASYTLEWRYRAVGNAQQSLFGEYEAE